MVAQYAVLVALGFGLMRILLAIPYKAASLKPVSMTVQLVLDMLSNPDGWEVKKYRVVHVTGAAIWIGNRPESAALCLNGDVSPHDMNGGQEVETTVHERRLMFAAAKILADRYVANEHAAKVAEWAASVKRYADNVVELRK